MLIILLRRATRGVNADTEQAMPNVCFISIVSDPQAADTLSGYTQSLPGKLGNEPTRLSPFSASTVKTHDKSIHFLLLSTFFHYGLFFK
jgi:hypothetical protein